MIDLNLNPFRMEPIDLGGSGGTFLPNVDVRETDEAVFIQADLPGVSAKDIDLEVLGGVLSLRAEKRQTRDDRGRAGTASDRSWNTFERSVPLPQSADAARATARFENGDLTVTVPKSVAPGAGRGKIAIRVTA